MLRDACWAEVLDDSRAQNIAIVLSKLPVSSEDVCEALRTLDFSRLALSDDMVELLASILPTPEETQKLQTHKDCPERLRDIEQKVLPFCFLPRAAARLRFFRFAASHAESAATYLQRCRTLQLAAMEARSSQELRRVLALILRIGNYINHGIRDVSDGAGACAFSIETLAAITSFKLGSMSSLQFLCTSFRRANPRFLDALQTSLKHVPKAAREKSMNLKSCIQAFRKEVDFAEREVSSMPEDQLSEVTAGLLKDLNAEAFELENSLAMAYGKCEEAQQYLCTSEDKANDAAPPPYENLFLHLSDFLESFRKAWTAPAKQASKQKTSYRPDKLSTGLGTQDKRTSTALPMTKSCSAPLQSSQLVHIKPLPLFRFPCCRPGMASVDLTIKPVQESIERAWRGKEVPAGANACEFRVSIDTTATVNELKEKAGNGVLGVQLPEICRQWDAPSQSLAQAQQQMMPNLEMMRGARTAEYEAHSYPAGEEDDDPSYEDFELDEEEATALNCLEDLDPEEAESGRDPTPACRQCRLWQS
eukprot:s8849_g1.t2